MSVSPVFARLFLAVFATGTVGCRDFMPRATKADAGSVQVLDAAISESKDAEPPGDGNSDAEADSGTDDSEPRLDGGREAGTDGDPQQLDSGHETGADEGDPQPDSGRDTGADADLDGESDSGPHADASADTGTSTINVRGQLIDFWRNRLPGVDVHIGDAQATTDANGTFTITGVTPPYDVWFVVRTAEGQQSITHGWQYQGLTRTDPTLQVRQGLRLQRANVLLGVTTLELPLEESEQGGAIAYGNSHWQPSRWSSWGLSTLVHTSAAWEGLVRPTMNVHGLVWTHADNDIPNGYLAHATQPLPLEEGADLSVTLDLKPVGVPHDHASGSVVSPLLSSGERFNIMNVDYVDGVSMYVVNESPTTSTFDYIVPNLPGLSATIGAGEGDPEIFPYAIAYRRGITPGSSGISLTIPERITLETPSQGQTGVDEQTEFSWSGSAKVYVLEVNNYTEHYSWNVVTQNDHTVLPTFDGQLDFSLYTCIWNVKTHGYPQTVDEAVGPQGLLHVMTENLSLDRAEGSFAVSDGHFFNPTP